MQNATAPSPATRHGALDLQFPPLDRVNRPYVPTEQAAYYLTRQPQTLRAWASSDAGLVRPIRLNGRLAWPVAEIRRILGV